MTLYELDLLSVQHRRQQEREDRRACFAGWLLVNMNRDTDKRREPFALAEVTEWLGYASSYVAPARAVVEEAPATPDEIARKFEALYTLHQLSQGHHADEGREE